MFSGEFREISKNAFFAKHLWWLLLGIIWGSSAHEPGTFTWCLYLLMSRKTKRKLKLFKSIKETNGSHILIYETQYVAQFELSVFSYFYDDSVRNDVFPNETFD